MVDPNNRRTPRKRKFIKRTGNMFPLYTAGVESELKVIRMISPGQADSMVRAKKAVLLKYNGMIVYQLLKDGATVAKPMRESKPSCTTLSKTETEAAAGLMGRSQTIGLSKRERDAREFLRMPAFDYVERCMVKLEGFRPVSVGSGVAV